MQGSTLGLALCVMTFSVSSIAQTNTFPASGNVGIGTTNPTLALQISTAAEATNGLLVTGSDEHSARLMGSICASCFSYVVQAGDAGIIYSAGGLNSGGFAIAPWGAGSGGMRLDNNGNVGIGTTTPTAMLTVNGSAAVGGSFISGSTAGKYVYLLGEFYDGTSWQSNSVGGAVAYNGTSYLVGTDGGTNGGWLMRSEGGGDTLDFYTISSNGGASQTISPANLVKYSRMLIANNGNIGIGTTTPGSVLPSGYITGTPILEVKGDIVLTKSSGGSLTFQDGTTQSTAYTGVLCGGDYAESVDAGGDKKNYEAGDVLVIGSDDSSDVVKSSTPYSTFVAGVYSTKPGLVGRRQTIDMKADSAEVPMAMVGIVPTKVTTENGPIHRGDLLVSSSLPGYAMKGTDQSRLIGAVLGKAMGSLDSGSGVIEVLVTLQ